MSTTLFILAILGATLVADYGTRGVGAAATSCGPFQPLSLVLDEALLCIARFVIRVIITLLELLQVPVEAWDDMNKRLYYNWAQWVKEKPIQSLQC